ncbi:MAG: type VI secretion system baseplate subunit TssG [Pirellulaceae bacterium]|nr:type VI secretion system baseplate subunit TssG [Pirellulaceae bacterium]
MAGPDGASAELVALWAELVQAPHEFDLFHALRRLECAAADRPRLGESARAKDDPVRLCQEPSMAFAPRTIHALVPGPNGTPPRLEVLCFGLFGPNGPLPFHLTEYARDRIRHHGDATFARFADIFHHRLMSLFYRAWANAQPTVNLDRPEANRFATSVGALVGLASSATQHRDAVPDHAKLHYSGLLSAGPRHPGGLRAMLEDFFGLPVQLEEFVGRWTEIPAECRCVLTREGHPPMLGMTSTIGSHVWDCQQTFRIVIGPLSLADYRRLLPGGESLTKLADMVRNYLNDELIWELKLILLQPQVPPVRLGTDGHLGLNAWIEPDGLLRDADDFCHHPQLEQNLKQTPWLARDLAELHRREPATALSTTSSEN